MNAGQYIKTEWSEDGNVLIITLDHQSNAKNQIATGMVEALLSVLHPEQVKPSARAIVLRSSKPKVFSTGADIEDELKDLDPTEAARFAVAGREVFGLFSKVPCPTVALLAGFALGGGLELALCCDFRIATRNARMGLPEINLGVLPGWGGTQRLPRLIGRSRALKMILGGDVINGATALEYGLVDELVEGYDDLLPNALTLLEKFTAKSRSAIGHAKRAIHEGGDMALADGLALESEIFGLAWGTADRVEGIKAYMEKRKPRFSEQG